MVALVDDDLTVGLKKTTKILPAHEGLKHRDINDTAGTIRAATATVFPKAVAAFSTPFSRRRFSRS